MAGAGCELLENTSGKAVMIYNAFSHVIHFYKLIKQISRYLAENSVDLVVVCDSPSFNFHIAKAAKKSGIKTLFYVAPQLWAWGRRRIGKLRKYCDKLCCILPFEQRYLRDRGVRATYVGSPVFETLRPRPASLPDLAKAWAAGTWQVAMLPGSRPAEIAGHMPAMLAAAASIQPDLRSGPEFPYERPFPTAPPSRSTTAATRRASRISRSGSHAGASAARFCCTSETEL